MNRLSKYLFFFIAFAPLIVHAQMTVHWTQVLKNRHCNPNAPVLAGMDVDTDGNSYFLHYNRVPYTCEFLIFLKKSNPDGLPLWEVLVDTVDSFSYSSWSNSTQLRWGQDGSVVFGWNGDYDCHIYKYNTNGNRIWSWSRNVYPAPNSNCHLQQIEQDDAGNVFIALDIRDSGANYTLGMHFIKFTAGGTKWWEIVPAPQRSTTGFNDLFPDGQGGMIGFFGNPYDQGSLPQTVSFSINTWGQFNWQAIETDRIPFSGTLDSQGNLIVIQKDAPGWTTEFAYKYSPSGALLWQRNITPDVGFETTFGMVSDLQSNLYIWGDSAANIRISKYDSSGNFLWNFAYVPAVDRNEDATKAVVVANNLFVLGYQTAINSIPPLHHNAFVIKVDPSGILASEKHLQSYPIPGLSFQGNFMVQDNFGNILVASGYNNLYTTVNKVCTESCYPNISGHAFLDLDSTCILDSSRLKLPQQIIKFDQGSLYTITDSGGYYGFRLDSGTVSYDLSGLPFWNNSCNPGPWSITVTPTSYFHDSLNFGMYAPPAPQLAISVANTPARPGFVQRTTLQYANLGGIEVPPRIVLELDSNAIFDQATPAPDSVIGNRLVWLPDTLDIFGHGRIDVLSTLQTTALHGTPYANHATIFPIQGDLFPPDNQDSVNIVVTGSYDPNDKMAQPAGEGPFGDITLAHLASISYQIRFQNTGTDTAFKVVVRDTIEENLDLSTFQMGAASHSYHLTITDGRVFQWTFDNILLPDSNVNEPFSHGFIKFRINPRPGLQIGDTIRNKAGIYFDFNLPVITNEVFHNLQLPTETKGPNAEGALFEAFPNPITLSSTNNQLSVRWRGTHSGEKAHFRLVDLQGVVRIHGELSMSTRDNAISLQGLPQGVYLLEMTSKSSTSVKKVLIMN